MEFHDLLKKHLAMEPPGHGQQAAFARKHGIEQSRLTRYLAGAEPAFSEAVRIIASLGGDIARALPGWTPPAPPVLTDHETITPAGTISSGDAVYTPRTNLPPVPPPEINLRASAWYPHTRNPESANPCTLIRIDGDSMAPDYPAGSHILCRPPFDPRTLPQGIHAIIKHHPTGRQTLKILHFSEQTARKYTITALPLDRRQPVEQHPNDEITIEQIALAMIHTRINAQPDPATVRYNVLMDSATLSPDNPSLIAEPAPSWRTGKNA